MGKALLEGKGISSSAAMRRFVFIAEDGTPSQASSAAFEVAKRMDFPWACLGWVGATAIPKALADAVYDSVAKRRYRLFGRTEHCQVPDSSIRARFLDFESVDEDERGDDARPAR